MIETPTKRRDQEMFNQTVSNRRLGVSNGRLNYEIIVRVVNLHKREIS